MDLGKQIGPLPLGAWFAVVGTGIGVAVWSRGTGSGTVGAPASEDGYYPEENPGVGTGVNGQWIDVSPPAPETEGPVADNDEWARRAIAWLIAQGYDPAMSQAAISKAMQERRLGVREYALWWVALRHFGPPPYAVVVPKPDGFNVTPHPPRDPPTTQLARDRWYRVQPGDTLRRIARKAYRDESKWHRIYEANRQGVRRPDGSRGWITSPRMPLTVGRRLFIPKG